MLIELTPKKTKILIGTPSFQRINLLKVFLEYMVYLINKIEQKNNFVVEFLVVGTSNMEIDVIKNFNNIKYDMIENILSHKKNYIVDYAKKNDFDYLIWIDSDDFIPLDLLGQVLVKAKGNGYWASTKTMLMFDTMSKEIAWFRGYHIDQNRRLATQGLGTCRVFTKKFLELLSENPYGLNKTQGMDALISPYLSNLNLDVDATIYESPLNETLVAIKTNENIWGIDDYANRSNKPPYSLVKTFLSLYDHDFDWMPKDTKDKLSRLDYNNP